jgi:hypothetical protein
MSTVHQNALITFTLPVLQAPFALIVVLGHLYGCSLARVIPASRMPAAEHSQARPQRPKILLCIRRFERHTRDMLLK